MLWIIGSIIIAVVIYKIGTYIIMDNLKISLISISLIIGIVMGVANIFEII